jgi:hypothetical protein
MKNGDDPVHPIIIDDVSQKQISLTGITKRELISAMCLQGLLSNASGILEPKHWVDWAVIYADRLLDELSKERE